MILISNISQSKAERRFICSNITTHEYARPVIYDRADAFVFELQIVITLFDGVSGTTGGREA